MIKILLLITNDALEVLRRNICITAAIFQTDGLLIGSLTEYQVSFCWQMLLV